MLGAVAADFWWVLPGAAAATGAVLIGVRRRDRTRGGKRLAYDAARAALTDARRRATLRRVDLKVARAEHARLVAERAANPAADVAGARRGIRQAEKAVKAADAAIRAEKARLSAARAELGAIRDPHEYPLARLEAAHDHITKRWLDYETDPAKLIAFPTMSDAREPQTALFLAAAERARTARPGPFASVSPQDFAAYRDAVAELAMAFEEAERVARRRAGMPDQAPDRPGWQGAAQQVITRSAEALDRAADAAASAIAAWNRRDGSGGSHG